MNPMKCLKATRLRQMACRARLEAARKAHPGIDEETCRRLVAGDFARSRT